jgi:hypothetical protein
MLSSFSSKKCMSKRDKRKNGAHSKEKSFFHSGMHGEKKDGSDVKIVSK